MADSYTVIDSIKILLKQLEVWGSSGDVHCD